MKGSLMEINQVREQKSILEDEIFHLVKHFENITDVSVVSINVLTANTLNVKQNDVIDISVEIKI